MAYEPKDYKRDIVEVSKNKPKAKIATKHKRRGAAIEEDETSQRFNGSERSHKNHWVRRYGTNNSYTKLVDLLKSVVRKYYGQPIQVCYAHFSRVIDQVYKGEPGTARIKTIFWNKIVKDGNSSDEWYCRSYNWVAKIVEDENKYVFTIEPL